MKGSRGVLNRGNTLPAIQGYEASGGHPVLTRRQRSEIGQTRHRDSAER